LISQGLTLEMNEVSLVIRTPKGLAIVVGCSHPGVEKILEGAAKIDSRLYTVTGGFHLVLTPQEKVQRIANVLRNTLAPHCRLVAVPTVRERSQSGGKR
jgi:7,8-dihydropterin-6-yl-methyl-4-(beta-D-ribofuranosyl)aminobenzene 5'-phosphate synthase